MTDNPLNQVLPSDKLSLIAQYDASRASSFIAASQERGEGISFPIREGPAWELAGGVLALSTDRYDIYFRQLPAIKRGIFEKIWNLRLAFPHVDFTMDPGQDLLVVVEERATQPRYESHIILRPLHVF
jgi:hypothetical protein